MIFDFTDAAIFGEEQAASWWESSDTVRWEQLQQFGKVFTTVYYKIKLIRSAGMSKAVFSLQRSVRFQRALLFAIINPQVTFLSLGTWSLFMLFCVCKFSCFPESRTQYYLNFDLLFILCLGSNSWKAVPAFKFNLNFSLSPSEDIEEENFYDQTVSQPNTFTFQPNGAGFAGMKTNITFSDQQLKVNFQYIYFRNWA